MTGIIGSGFGLYGYLPAVLSREPNVFLLERAREKFLGRKELSLFFPSVVWKENIVSLLQSIDVLIISIPPKEQSQLLYEVINHPRIKKVIIEKPVAATPADSRKALVLLQQNQINFRISYSFLFLNWYQEIVKQLRPGTKNIEIKIFWYFKAHHYKNDLNNWKRFHSTGGGAIRFFGIHLIAVVAILGFTCIDTSTGYLLGEDDFYKWYFSVSDASQNVFIADINSNSDTERFEIFIKQSNGQESKIYQANTPFGGQKNHSTKLDNRVPLLGDLFQQLRAQDFSDHLFNLYEQIIDVWEGLEAQLQIEHIKFGVY